MVKYFIIPIIVLVVLMSIAFLFRRKHIREIGRLEHEKMQIQNKPIFEEMMKVKQLNMTGETEEKFERWRSEWTEVIDVHMPKIDSLLFDAEDMIDRFRFKKATTLEKEIQGKIRQCDRKKNEILDELNELIGSEEKNRIEIEKLREQYRSARKTILAHQHAFGMTVEPLEKELESFTPKFKEYDELTENGNYLLAREIVLLLTSKGEQLSMLLHDIPSLLIELQSKIPTAIRELRNGIREMESQSYSLKHLELSKQLSEIEEGIEEQLAKMSSLEIDSVRQQVTEMHDRIDSFYDALENEVNARHYVDLYFNDVEESLTQTIHSTMETSDEAIYVQQSYRLDEKEAKLPQLSLKKLEGLQNRFDILKVLLQDEESAYSSLQTELKEISDELEGIEEERERLANRMKNLRIDENNVRNKLNDLSKELQNVDRKLHRGNIPGIPDEMDARLEEAEEQLYLVSQSLQEVPLNMAVVDSYLANATMVVEEVKDKVEELLENVMLIERIIQYGNRYRAANPAMNERLLMAEESFRQFRYAKALEEAATAVEEVEPGSMRRIEEMLKEHV
ncbi:septation ring formation regulator EzrA [Sporosarcina highlanderae]|uniref:Septation ring formation regulator EzrA n=1 Tax=Sporosarcina highlanderae TaxID=3035916 RepID=A0ABT8JPE5_9BACL|nr:septation ring formation regulator EzrA [Sporosarcina highlanderae]MDN4607013.1 septation ring formation regulator EzrA [Sporosarcina highlanderae]